MTDIGEAFEAITGLAVGGLIFIVFGSAFAGTALDSNILVNFTFWGLLYIIAALVLAVILVGGIIATLFEGL